MATKKPAKKADVSAKSKTKITHVVEKNTKNFNIAKIVKNIKNTDSDVDSGLLPAKIIAEFLGVFIISMVMLTAQANPLIIMIALIATVLMFNKISGSHLNPAITIGAWATKQIPLVKAIAYVVAQVFGAFLAIVVMNAFLGAAPKTEDSAMMAQQFELLKARELPAENWTYLVFSEMLLAGIFSLAVASVFKSKSSVKKALTYAFAFTSVLFIGTYISAIVQGSAIANPAFATALSAFSQGHLDRALLVYAVAPIIGSIIGFFLYSLLKQGEEKN